MNKSQNNARSSMYKYLSLVIDYPTGQTADLLGSGMFLTESAVQLKKLPPAYQNLAGSLSALEKELTAFASLEDLQVVYTTYFDMAVNKPSFSLYESVNIMPTAKAEKTAVFLADLETLYGRQGIILSDRDMPDHLATELEFMHFLCSQKNIEQQIKFLNDHLINWVPLLAQQFSNQTNVNFYPLLIAFIAQFLVTDSQELD
jgi:TorA maturation chaperone TorD